MNSYVYNNCVNLTSINNTVFWGNNSTNLTLDVLPFMWPPIITYKEQLKNTGNVSLLYYQWCGPLMLIMSTIAKQMNAKYNY
jgi:hypothetical protein